MPRLSENKLPAYRCHKARQLAVVTLDGKDIYLGPYGSSSSRREYDRVIAEWLANGRRVLTAPEDKQPGLTIVELIAA